MIEYTPIAVPTLAFAARSGTVGHERFNEALTLVGSPLMAALLRLADVPVLHGYEYRDAPGLVEPHLRRFLADLGDAHAP